MRDEIQPASEECAYARSNFERGQSLWSVSRSWRSPTVSAREDKKPSALAPGPKWQCYQASSACAMRM